MLGTVHSILIPLNVHQQTDGAISHAIALAKVFSSYIEALIVKPVFPNIANESMVPTDHYDQLHLQNWHAKAKEVRARFVEAMRHADFELTNADMMADFPTAGWREMEGIEHVIIGEYGRIFDLIVIGREREDRRNEVVENYETALFESGRPVLLVPIDRVDTIGRTVVISWNGSTEAARTVALGMPFIDRAEVVFVLSVEGGMVSGPTAEDVATYLARRGVNATPIVSSHTNNSDGATILEMAASLGADMLLKGAYTHSRLRQVVLGGATKHILQHANLPVLMAH